MFSFVFVKFSISSVDLIKRAVLFSFAKLVTSSLQQIIFKQKSRPILPLCFIFHGLSRLADQGVFSVNRLQSSTTTRSILGHVDINRERDGEFMPSRRIESISNKIERDTVRYIEAVPGIDGRKHALNGIPSRMTNELFRGEACYFTPPLIKSFFSTEQPCFKRNIQFHLNLDMDNPPSALQPTRMWLFNLYECQNDEGLSESSELC